MRVPWTARRSNQSILNALLQGIFPTQGSNLSLLRLLHWHLRPLRGLQETRVATREESGVLGFPSRRGLTPRGSLECSPRDSQESSPAPQFKTINSSVLSFLYSPTLTSIHAGDLRELPRVPLRGEGSCGGGGAPRDSAGSGATHAGRGLPAPSFPTAYTAARACQQHPPTHTHLLLRSS